MWNPITVGDCLTFPVNQQCFQVIVLCCAATNACHLTDGVRLDHRKTFLEINFLRLIRQGILLKEFIVVSHTKHQERQNHFHEQQEQDLFRKR